jgi:hypothetical protein
MRQYLFSYRYDGHEYGLTIPADSADEAKGRAKAIAMARYDGELMMTIPAGGGWIARLIVWARNAAKAA